MLKALVRFFLAALTHKTDSAAPDQIRAFELRVPPSHRMLGDSVDGSKAEKSTWYKPAEGILPAPLSRERLEESMNISEERKQVLRQKMKDKPK